MTTAIRHIRPVVRNLRRSGHYRDAHMLELAIAQITPLEVSAGLARIAANVGLAARARRLFGSDWTAGHEAEAAE